MPLFNPHHFFGGLIQSPWSEFSPDFRVLEQAEADRAAPVAACSELPDVQRLGSSPWKKRLQSALCRQGDTSPGRAVLCPSLVQPCSREAIGNTGRVRVAVSHQQSGAAAGGASLELGFLWFSFKKTCVTLSHIIILLLQPYCSGLCRHSQRSRPITAVNTAVLANICNVDLARCRGCALIPVLHRAVLPPLMYRELHLEKDFVGVD